MTFKTIIQGKSEYYCDVCGKELHYGDRILIGVSRTWADKSFDLCSKHGKIISKKIEELKEEESK